MKTCKKCLVEKTCDLFNKDKNNKDGISIYCRNCEIDRKREYREKNRKKINDSAKLYRKNNPEKYKESVEKYLKKNPHMTSKERMKKYMGNQEIKKKYREKSKEHYKKNIDKNREYRKKYYQENKETERKKNDEWRKNKLKTDGFFRMKRRLRERIRDYMKGKTISKKTKDILGMDYESFKTYISNKFKEGMNWENYGLWHLDHIKPLCEAKDEEELFKLNHYTNLQPLWAEENIKKNRKYGN